MFEEKNNINTDKDNEDFLICTDGCHPSKQSSFFNFIKKIASSKYLKWFIIALLPVLFLLKYPVDIVDYDLWWHMALGKYYVTHHTLTVDHSIFSWTPTDPTWIYNTCLGSIAIYLFYNFMGGLGLWIMHSMVFLGVFLSFYFFLRLLKLRLDVNSVTMIAVLAIGCSPACRYYKPELFSLLMFCWTLFVFFHVKVSGRKFLFYIYPLIFVLWVNLHGGFVVGLVFLAMAFMGEILNRIFFPKESLPNETLIHLGIACILSALATLLNPYGVDYLISTYMGVTSKDYAQTHNSYISAYASLWSYLKNIKIEYFNVNSTAWIMTMMYLSLTVVFIYELLKRRSSDFTLLIVSISLYWKGMTTSRASYFFLVASFFVVFFLFVHRLKIKNFSYKITMISLLIFSSLFMLTFYHHIRYEPYNQWFGKGIDDYAPLTEVDFLKKYKIEGPIFNDYVVGGYLMWKLYPDYKVFVDPRCGPYMNQVIPDYLAFTGKHVNSEDIRNFRKKYPFKLVVLHYRQMNLIFDFLRSEGDEWRLLYFEKNAAILMHQSLLPIIKTEVGNVNLSPARFSKERNPSVLLNVFNFYVRLDPEAGRYICEIFKRNVSNFYKLKSELLVAMNDEIKAREKEIQDQQIWWSR